MPHNTDVPPASGAPTRVRRRIALALPIVAVVGAAATVAATRVPLRPPPGGPGGVSATVVRVIDGDTLEVDIGGRRASVRLIGIDTPETVHPDKPAACFGPEASARLGALLPAGSTVRLTRDVEPRDAYDRLLAYVERTPDGLLVNADLVAAGYAEAEHHPPNTVHRDRFERAERAARAAGLGLWSACGGTDVPLRHRPRAG
ncbi:MAG TPA: thermonuclease family protein [Acidimicrobiales bacterium]